MKNKQGLMVAIGMPKGAPADGAQNETQDEAGMNAGEDCIPLKSLAMPDPDQGDQMANPEVGDKVNYQIEGTVTRIEGDNAYVKREAVNGQPVDEQGEDEDQPGDEGGGDTGDTGDQTERDQLGGMAEQMGGM